MLSEVYHLEEIHLFTGEKSNEKTLGIRHCCCFSASDGHNTRWWASFPRTEASGSFITTSTTIHSETEDKLNTIIDLSSTVTYTGTLEGTSTLQGNLIVRRDGSATLKGVEAFTGLVDGISGTLTFKLEGSSNLYQAIQIKNLITSGARDLSNFQGQISKVGIIKDNGPVGTYIGQISH